MNAPAPTGLVPRQHYAEAVRLTDEGLSRDEIARRLGITVSALGKILAAGPWARPVGRRVSAADQLEPPIKRTQRAFGEVRRLVFEVVRDRGPVTITEISIAARVHNSAVSAILTRLVAEGVVAREYHSDGRMTHRLAAGGDAAFGALAAAGRRATPEDPSRGRVEEQRMRTRVLTVALEIEAQAAEAYREAVRLSQWGLQQHFRGEVLAAQAAAREAAREAARVGVDVAREVEAWRARMATHGVRTEHGATARLGGHR